METLAGNGLMQSLKSFTKPVFSQKYDQQNVWMQLYKLYHRIGKTTLNNVNVNNDIVTISEYYFSLGSKVFLI